MRLATTRISRALCVLALSFGFVSTTAAQEVIHYWAFNDPGTNPEAWPPPVEADIGEGELTHNFEVEGSRGHSAFQGTPLNAEEGFDRGSSFSPEGQHNNGNHFTLHIPTAGFEDIVITYATQRTSTGFTSQEWEFSIDGGTVWLPIETVTDIPSSFGVREVDLSHLILANDAEDLQVRVTVDGATSASGNNRFDNITVTGTPLEAISVDGGATARVLALDSVYPNPLSGRAAITFALPAAGDATVALYDLLGRRVAVLASGEHGAGPHRVDLDGSSLAAGIYVVRLAAGGGVVTRRLTVVR